MTIYFASGNAHKAEELRGIAGRTSGLEIHSAAEIGGMPDVAEDTGTFIGNAAQKALALRPKAPPEAWVLADDSGLCVDALGGAPGVDSAVYAGRPSNAAANRDKLLRALKDVPAERRTAHFVCIFFLIGPNGAERIYGGRSDGTLLFTERGAGGFGYDPLFVPGDALARGRTMAELSADEKNGLSHRARAWASLWAEARLI